MSCPPLRETSKSSRASAEPLALIVRRLKKVGSKSLSFLDFIGMNFGLSGREFTISKGPGVALTYSRLFVIFMYSSKRKGRLSIALGSRKP